jgi:DNA-binding NarL/FixJ family response regulator
MVKVKIIAFTRLELTGGNQQIKKKIIQLVSRIKVVLLAALGGVSRILASKFCDSTKYSIRGAKNEVLDEAASASKGGWKYLPCKSRRRNRHTSVNG